MRREGYCVRNGKAINDIFLSCRNYLAHVVSRIAPPDEIEDIVQETYVRACQIKLDSEIKEPRALMVTIAKNLAFDHLKRADRRLTVQFEDGAGVEHIEDNASGADPLRRIVSNEEFAFFCEAVRLLPAQCRKVFVLKKVYGYSQREISKKLNISESTVEKHVAKGMRQCANFLDQRVDDPGQSVEALTDCGERYSQNPFKSDKCNE